MPPPAGPSAFHPGPRPRLAMIDVAALRSQFPALHHRRAGRLPVFLDGPGGTQVPRSVIDAVADYLALRNANHGGVFATSRESDALLDEAHQAAADLLNAPSADEVIFGANMTTLTLHLGRALARTLREGDEVLVTRLDHDANVRPWVLAARDAGAAVRWVDFHPEDGTLDLDDFRRQLSPRTRLAAFAAASNALGTLNDVPLLTRWAHEAGAWVFVDAVHYAPHGPIDVQAWGCDFLACSAYKFFGPHVGILWGSRERLESLPAYKVRPAPDALPGRWMTGTQNHEGIAGTRAAISYLADIGATGQGLGPATRSVRRGRLLAGLAAIRDHEADLGRRLLEGLAARPRFRTWGITRPEDLGRRVPTFAVTAAGSTPGAMAAHLAAREIYAWSGNFYALELTERLGLEDKGGLLRLGLVHYNTPDEVDRLLQALDELP